MYLCLWEFIEVGGMIFWIKATFIVLNKYTDRKSREYHIYLRFCMAFSSVSRNFVKDSISFYIFLI
jgi:hypothetical protein